MSKRRASERGAGESSGRSSKLLCPGISGSNAKRVGPFVLGKLPRVLQVNLQHTSFCVSMQARGGGGIGSVRSPLFEKNCRNVLDWWLHFWICRSFPVCHYHTVILPLKCTHHSWKYQCDVVVQGAVIRVFMIGLKGSCCALYWLLHLFTILFFIPPHLNRPTAGKLSRAEYSAVSCQKGWDGWFLSAKSEYFFRPCLHGVNILGEHKWSGETDHHIYLASNSCRVTICDCIA